ncbi:GNAT family N-acetyltransferase [Brevibacillus sp. B_LB10_24]|uniref:GNAT family N-acetyltransferase n=1 Tax=Brevibacillus sp. B_LB10_24 TaxID=3380645 RepID=UPI0038BA1689
MLPTFSTERLIIRPRELADLEACLKMDRDPEVVRFISGPWTDEAKHKEFVLSRMKADYPEGLGYWTVLKKEDNAFLGWIMLIPVDARGPEIEIGWRLIRDAWGKGYATEAAKPILRYGFETVGIDEAIAEIHPDNLGSMRVSEKIGLRDRGIRRNGEESVRRYSLTRMEYAAMNHT